MDKRALQIAAKVGLLLVIIGFFLPISCGKNGFEISDTLRSSGKLFSADRTASILLYVLFVSALLGVVLLLINKHFIGLDWTLFAVSSGSGLFAVSLVSKYSEFSSIQVGGYLIVLGYLVTGICLLFATYKTIRSSNRLGDGHDTST